MRSKLIGSKEAIENFQFVTINGRVEFEGVERISRIAYYYSKAVKAGVNLALKGVSLNDAVKELYNIIPYAFYAETAYDDIGVVIDPALAEGQVHGGATQAVGQAILEEAIINEEGQLVVTYADYLIPTAVEAPKFESYFAEKPHASQYPSGAKGVGEAALIVRPAAIVRALEDATGKRFNHTQVRLEELIE